MVELYCYDINRIDYTFEYSIDRNFPDDKFEKLLKKVSESLPIFLDRCSDY